MNKLFCLFLICVFIILFENEERIRLRYTFFDGLVITASLICAGVLMSFIGIFGDLSVFRLPLTALACFGVYALIISFFQKEKTAGIIIPTAMVSVIELSDFSIINLLYYGLIMTLMLVSLNTIKMRIEIHAKEPFSGIPAILVSEGLIFLAIDGVK